ncbi:hypothetical protein JCM15765_39850 [Paradesulfitobacterium aromaticivorans]
MPMSDVIPKKVPIELDKKRNLVYDLNALSALEETYGAVDQAFAEVEKGSAKAIRALLWAGLISEDPELTQSQAGTLVGLSGLTLVSQKILEAVEAALPDPNRTAPSQATDKEA